MRELQDTDKMPWGKYAGLPMQDVPVGYLHYLWEQGKSRDTRCPVADYIRRNINGLKLEDPDKIWTGTGPE